MSESKEKYVFFVLFEMLSSIWSLIRETNVLINILIMLVSFRIVIINIFYYDIIFIRLPLLYCYILTHEFYK